MGLVGRECVCLWDINFLIGRDSLLMMVIYPSMKTIDEMFSYTIVGE